MKKILTILMIVVLIIFVSGCINKKELTDGQKFKEEYEIYNGKKTDRGVYPTLEIPENNIIKYSTLKEVNEILSSGTGVIYLGFPKCPWCRNAIKVLLDSADSTTLDKIYYVDMQNERDIMKIDGNGNIVTTQKASDDYYKLVEKLKDILPDYIIYDSENNEYNTNTKRIYVPLVLFIENGQLVDYHMDTVESQKDPYVDLTEEQYNELYNIYTSGIHKVLKDICDDKC